PDVGLYRTCQPLRLLWSAAARSAGGIGRSERRDHCGGTETYRDPGERQRRVAAEGGPAHHRDTAFGAGSGIHAVAAAVADGSTSGNGRSISSGGGQLGIVVCNPTEPARH